MEKKIIYLDHAATTATRPEVVDAMLPYFTENFWNPSSVYTPALNNRKVVDESRETIARSLGTTAENIYFTAGGSESDNWALKCTAEAYANKGKHIITSKIEHHAILHTCEYLEKKGFEITYIDVDENGILKLDDLKAAIRPDTILISVMFANNEIGTIQPIKEIGAIAKEHGILFHTDAVQAYAQIPINVDEYNIDMLSVSGHKFGGPKGIGFLYIRKGLKLRSFIHGGAQERKRRAGTENITGIVGIAKAVEIAFATMDERIKHETEVRDYAIKRILAEVPYCRLNGDAQKRVPNNINISFQFIEGESLLIMLDMAGICASSGSACTSGSLDPSHVLLAIGLPHEIAHGSLRMTIGEETTKEDMDYVVDNIKEIVTKLRTMSPLYEDFVKKNNLSYSSTLEDFSKILNVEAGNTEEGLTVQAYIEKDNDSGKKIVMFKPGLSDIEKEFAFAHEIAHIINNDAIPASRPDAHNKDFIEQRADYTAAAILMPINEVSTFLKEKKYDSLSRKGRMAIVKDLCEKYNVTEVNALRRIREIQKLEKNSSIL